MIWLQYKKKILLVLGAILFLVAIFVIKNDYLFKFRNNSLDQVNKSDGLTYDTKTFGELVNQDTDVDGVPDWQEKLWGTDPSKKETTPGTPDRVTIEKRAREQSGNFSATNGVKDKPENLTETEKFSRDLFNTVAAATEEGQGMSQDTVDQLASSLNNTIQNSIQRKVFTLADVKIINDESKASIQKYADTLNSFYYVKNPVKYTVIDVLQKFIGDGENVNMSVLKELDPIIAFTNKTLADLIKTSTPKYLAVAHLNVLNNLEKVLENINDIKLFDTDIIVALSSISKYADNASALQLSLENLSDLIAEKLNN